MTIKAQIAYKTELEETIRVENRSQKPSEAESGAAAWPDSNEEESQTEEALTPRLNPNPEPNSDDRNEIRGTPLPLMPHI